MYKAQYFVGHGTSAVPSRQAERLAGCSHVPAPTSRVPPHRLPSAHFCSCPVPSGGGSFPYLTVTKKPGRCKGRIVGPKVGNYQGKKASPSPILPGPLSSAIHLRLIFSRRRPPSLSSQHPLQPLRAPTLLTIRSRWFHRALSATTGTSSRFPAPDPRRRFVATLRTFTPIHPPDLAPNPPTAPCGSTVRIVIWTSSRGWSSSFLHGRLQPRLLFDPASLFSHCCPVTLLLLHRSLFCPPPLAAKDGHAKPHSALRLSLRHSLYPYLIAVK